MPLSDLDLAGLAAAAYTSVPTWYAGDVHACLTVQDNVPVVAFRGTEPDNLADWLRDFDAVPIWRSGIGWVDRGFMTGAESVWAAISAGTTDNPLVLTGHSLGGALAVATAALAVRAGRSGIVLVTFGAPRVGENSLARLLDACVIRQYRHGNDPVTEVPPLYEHARPPLIQIGTDSDDLFAQHELSGYQAALQVL